MFRLPFAILLTLASPLAAEGKRLKVRFLAERVPPELGQTLLAAGETRTSAFDLPSRYLSDPLTPPAREFQIRAEKPDVALATIKLPDGGNSFIAILLPDPAGGYRPFVIRADDPDFKPGDVCFLNHTDKTILGHVGTARFTLEASAHKTLRPAGARKENFYDVGFGIREETADRVLSTTRWPVDDKIRSYVFFYLNPTSGRLDYRAVDEFVQTDEP